MNRYAVLSLASFLAYGAVDSAHAATVSRTFYQNGGNACTGALPTFEGALRKRPKAIANEGTSPAFVTCSAVSNDQNSEKPATAFVYVTNRSTAPVNLTCTFVNGDEFYGSTATPQTVNVAVNTLTPVLWYPTSPATTFDRDTVSVSCSLPPGMEINFFGQVINQDIGA